MQVLYRNKGYAQDPTRYLHFGDYSSECGDFVIIQGGFGRHTPWSNYNFSPADFEKIKSKKIVRLEFEEPNKFFIADYPQVYDREFYKIFTICPYTAEWLNKKYGQQKRIPIYFPIHEKYLQPKRKKAIDIIYSGHIYSKTLRNELLELRKFHYAVISNSNDTIVTHKSVSYEEKMRLYSHSKITLVHNIIFKPYIHRIINLWFAGDFWNNKAFKFMPRPWKPWELFKKNIYMPQLKSRVFEAAASHSLILCQKDDFNVIERYFKPGKEFVYFESGSLEQTVTQILKNYPKYAKIAERAYQRAAKNYTVKAFVNTYLKNIR